MKRVPRWLPRLSAGQLLAVGAIAFLAVSAFVDVLTSIGQVSASPGPPKAQLGGQVDGLRMTVGREARLTFDLFLGSGHAMSPACVGANLTPEFKVVKVTFLGTPGGRWRADESCGGILETGSTIPIVIYVIPQHPGDYRIRVQPKVNTATVGVGTSGTVSVGS
ncbi:MAG: hypothetical protein ACYCZN_13005 [Candidatus Dormibacteria bacterium]